MNRVFVSGSLRADPQVSYTPKGQKIVTFPMLVEEGDFSIDVVFAGESTGAVAASKIGERVLVAGALVKMKTPARDVLRVRATKILPMEE